MKALSVMQPWASLIASGRKSVELRSWATHYRGLLVVASSKARVDGPRAREFGLERAPRGVTLALVEIVGVARAVHEDEARALAPVPAGWFAWRLCDARPLEPVPVVGRLGLFEIDLALVRVRTL